MLSIVKKKWFQEENFPGWDNACSSKSSEDHQCSQCGRCNKTCERQSRVFVHPPTHRLKQSVVNKQQQFPPQDKHSAATWTRFQWCRYQELHILASPSWSPGGCPMDTPALQISTKIFLRVLNITSFQSAWLGWASPDPQTIFKLKINIRYAHITFSQEDPDPYQVSSW